MLEWNLRNRIPIEKNEEQKFFETPGNEATAMYDKDTEDFIESIKKDPEFRELGEKEILELKDEVKKASQEYKEKEQGIIAKRLGSIRKFIKEFVEVNKTNKIFRTLFVALILESAFFGYEIPISKLKPEFSLVDNAVELAKTIKYEIKFDKEEKEIMGFLREKIRQNAIDMICDLQDNKGESGRDEKEVPLIENIKGLGVERGDIESILKTFPNSFVANIKKIQYETKNRKMPKAYGAEGEIVAQADIISREITIFENEKKFIEGTKETYLVSGKVVERKNYNELASTIAHEITHLNDWRSNSILSTKERFLLLKAIIERVESKNRCKLPYDIESFSNKDKKLELELKALEYFAGICDIYFNSPDLLPHKDLRIMQDLIKKIDPMYFQKKDKEDIKRLAIIEEMNNKSEEWNQ